MKLSAIKQCFQEYSWLALVGLPWKYRSIPTDNLFQNRLEMYTYRYIGWVLRSSFNATFSELSVWLIADNKVPDLNWGTSIHLTWRQCWFITVSDWAPRCSPWSPHDIVKSNSAYMLSALWKRSGILSNDILRYWLSAGCMFAAVNKLWGRKKKNKKKIKATQDL